MYKIDNLKKVYTHSTIGWHYWITEQSCKLYTTNMKKSKDTTNLYTVNSWMKKTIEKKGMHFNAAWKNKTYKADPDYKKKIL